VLTAWARRDGVRHMHAHFGTNSAEVVFLARIVGGPRYSFTVHGPDEWDQPRQHKLREKIAVADFVVGISAFTRAQLSRWALDGNSNKLHVVHCGLEPSFHSIPPAPTPDNHRLVCVGRLCRDKAQVLLIEAVGRLKREGVHVDLVLAGDGDARAEVERAVAREGLQDQVRITGWISSAQVREEIVAARALVLPSYAEGLPVVIMEALALRRPVIATWVAGIPELVRNGSEGWLFAPGSADCIVEAIRACLSTPIAQLRQMGERGRERVLERHDVDIEAAKLVGLFEGAVQ
jgi:colanic acid/amylovoran biosynthesis glycosyltransferase